MIDSAHAVHDNMRDHAGGVTSFGTSVIDQKSIPGFGGMF